ncbi:MAG: tripartite tricarboxylate transporter substrate binding protein [Planctomycetota bacterium]
MISQRQMFRIPSRLVAFVLSILWISTPIAQDKYPSRPIQVVIPFPPGGALDVGMRIIHPRLSAQLGVPLVLVNRPGAGGIIGLESVAKAAPDGYTLAATSTSTISVVAATVPNVPYKITDLTPVGNYAVDVNVIVARAGAPWKTLEELTDYARKNPGKLSYGSPGIGTLASFNVEAFKFEYGVDIVHVPFTGASQLKSALLGEHISLGAMPYSVVSAEVMTGALRPLATSASSRITDLPDVPTLTEKRVPEAISLVLGLFVPKGTPNHVVDILSKALQQSVEDPSISSAFRKTGMFVEFQDGKRVAKHIETEYRNVVEHSRKLKSR